MKALTETAAIRTAIENRKEILREILSAQDQVDMIAQDVLIHRIMNNLRERLTLNYFDSLVIETFQTKGEEGLKMFLEMTDQPLKAVIESKQYNLATLKNDFENLFKNFVE